MKWMLLVLIYGTIPVKTGLLFDTIDDCLKAEEQMRDSYIRTYNSWLTWAQANPKRGALSRQPEIHVAAGRDGDDRDLYPPCRARRIPGMIGARAIWTSWAAFC